MEKENLYLIHGGDYLRHIHEKLELFYLLRQTLFLLESIPDKGDYIRQVKKTVMGIAERSDDLLNSWEDLWNYMITGDPNDLTEYLENELIEPEYAGYVPADNPCCPGERCCEFAERIERENAAKRNADTDSGADSFECNGEPDPTELTGVCREILTAVERLTALLRSVFDDAD